MKQILLIISLLWLNMSIGQNYAIEQIIDSALTHPILKAESQSVEIQKALRKSSIVFDPTNFGLSYGAINETYVQDYLLSVNQNFYLPHYYKRRANLLETNIETQEVEYLHRKNLLIRNVKNAYYQLAFEQSSYLAYKELDSLHHNIERVIKKQLETGEMDFTVQANFVLESQQINLEVHQKKLAIGIALSKLHQFLPESVDSILTNELQILSFNDSNFFANNPLLKLSELHTSQEEKGIAVSKNALAIQWNIGYVNKSMSNQIVSEYNIGMNIPLWTNAQKAQVNAQKIRYVRAINQQQATFLQIRASYEQAFNEFQKNKESLKFYENTALPMMKKVIELSKKKYNKGEIDFLTYAQNIQKSIQMELNYLSAILAFNQSVIELEYLSGKL